MRRWLFAFGLIVSLVGAPFLATTPALAFGNDGNSPRDCIYFPETGHNICDTFHEWWVGWGDLATYGYPISEAYVDPNTGLITQWLQRARLEWHSGADPAHFNVELGLLGNEVAKRVPNQQAFQPATKRSGAGCTYFAPTKHNLCGGFYAYWKSSAGWRPSATRSLRSSPRTVSPFSTSSASASSGTPARGPPTSMSSSDCSAANSMVSSRK